MVVVVVNACFLLFMHAYCSFVCFYFFSFYQDMLFINYNIAPSIMTPVPFQVCSKISIRCRTLFAMAMERKLVIKLYFWVNLNSLTQSLIIVIWEPSTKIVQIILNGYSKGPLLRHSFCSKNNCLI